MPISYFVPTFYRRSYDPKGTTTCLCQISQTLREVIQYLRIASALITRNNIYDRPINRKYGQLQLKRETVSNIVSKHVYLFIYWGIYESFPGIRWCEVEKSNYTRRISFRGVRLHIRQHMKYPEKGKYPLKKKIHPRSEVDFGFSIRTASEGVDDIFAFCGGWTRVKFNSLFGLIEVWRFEKCEI